MILTRRGFLAASGALAAAVPAVDDWQGVARVVAVGDVHGDKEALAAVLRMAGVIDSGERWIGGSTHVVQIGDVPARGPQTRQAFDFLMRLEVQASAAGGKVHSLIGNHDAGVVYGDLRSTHPEEYGAFRSPDSEKKLEQHWRMELDSMRRAGRLPGDASEMEVLKKRWFDSHPPGFVEHREAFSPSGSYGAWIRRNNSVVRINNTLFLHAGISPRYLTRSRTSLNETIRQELANADRAHPGTAADTQGPLWYRGLSEGDERPLVPHLRAVLKFHGVERIVVGHTVTRSAILPRFGGRVINIDLGLSRFYGRPPACLVMEGHSRYVLHAGARIPLPALLPGERLRYLKAVEAADSQPSPITRLIEETGARPDIIVP